MFQLIRMSSHFPSEQGDGAGWLWGAICLVLTLQPANTFSVAISIRFDMFVWVQNASHRRKVSEQGRDPTCPGPSPQRPKQPESGARDRRSPKSLALLPGNLELSEEKFEGNACNRYATLPLPLPLHSLSARLRPSKLQDSFSPSTAAVSHLTDTRTHSTVPDPSPPTQWLPISLCR